MAKVGPHGATSPVPLPLPRERTPVTETWSGCVTLGMGSGLVSVGASAAPGWVGEGGCSWCRWASNGSDPSMDAHTRCLCCLCGPRLPASLTPALRVLRHAASPPTPPTHPHTDADAALHRLRRPLCLLSPAAAGTECVATAYTRVGRPQAGHALCLRPPLPGASPPRCRCVQRKKRTSGLAAGEGGRSRDRSTDPWSSNRTGCVDVPGAPCAHPAV